MAETSTFDSDVGFKANNKKTQIWSTTDAEPQQIEHLGLLACPTDATWAIIPKDKWAKLHTGISILQSVPGSCMVRLRLAYTYLRPLWTWGAPIVTPPPTATAKLLARAVWRTQNT
eukprot:3408593-Pyramimonas_sp.AAC.1